jgi:hypothetical protein
MPEGYIRSFFVLIGVGVVIVNGRQLLLDILHEINGLNDLLRVSLVVFGKNGAKGDLIVNLLEFFNVFE